MSGFFLIDIPDSFIPATLNVGHALPAMMQSAIFLVLLGVQVTAMQVAAMGLIPFAGLALVMASALVAALAAAPAG